MLKKKNKWFRLDNAAKIFPPTSTKRDSKVFRFACELKEDVDEVSLQKALDKALELFPGFKTTLKKGLFWYFLETKEIKPQVEKEQLPPCYALYNNDSKAILFRVTYYQKRINLEIYHALTDGTGAMEFLKVLVHYYIEIKYKKSTKAIKYDATDYEKTEDSFMKYYDSKKTKANIPNKFAYQMKGDKLNHNKFRIVEGYLKTDEVIKQAHKYNATITIFLTAVYMKAMYEDMPLKDQKKRITITIPVNLRKYFSSVTARNFFSTVNVSYTFKDNSDKLEDIIKTIKENLNRELEPSYIENQMNKFAALEHNYLVKFIPLFIKNPILKLSSLIVDMNSTCSLSNVGKVDMPEEFEQYIKRFSVFISTTKQQICVCSYKNELTIGFASAFTSTNVIKNFFRILTSENLETTITSNQIEK